VVRVKRRVNIASEFNHFRVVHRPDVVCGTSGDSADLREIFRRKYVNEPLLPHAAVVAPDICGIVLPHLKTRGNAF